MIGCMTEGLWVTWPNRYNGWCHVVHAPSKLECGQVSWNEAHKKLQLNYSLTLFSVSLFYVQNMCFAVDGHIAALCAHLHGLVHILPKLCTSSTKCTHTYLPQGLSATASTLAVTVPSLKTIWGDLILGLGDQKWFLGQWRLQSFEIGRQGIKAFKGATTV